MNSMPPLRREVAQMFAGKSPVDKGAAEKFRKLLDGQDAPHSQSSLAQVGGGKNTLAVMEDMSKQSMQDTLSIARSTDEGMMLRALAKKSMTGCDAVKSLVG